MKNLHIMNEYAEQEVKRNEILTSASEKTAVFALVTTLNALLLVNLNTKEVIPLEFNRPDYYGISWFPGGDELVLSHSIVRSDKLIELSDFALSEMGILSYGDLNTPPFLSSPHQILCASDGRVVCTNTGRNAISVIDLNKPKYFQETRLSSARWDLFGANNETGDHLNSIFEKNSQLYVIVHGLRKGSALATLSYPDLDLISLEPMDRLCLHNVWVTDEGQKIGCGSEEGELIELDGQGISTLWRAGTPIFSRGLAASSELVLVGESQYAAREMRSSSMSGMWLLDRKTWQAIDYFALGLFGDVRDIRLINIADEAHHGHVFEGLETLLKRDIRNAAAVKKIKISHLFSKNRMSSEMVVGEEVTIASQRRILSVNNLPEIENWGIWSHSNMDINDEFFLSAQKKILLGKGWAEIEDWGVWSDGDKASFTISVKNLPEKFKMELTYTGLVLPTYTKQTYEFFNEHGKLLKQCDFNYESGSAVSSRKVLLDINKKEDGSENGKTLMLIVKMLNPINLQKEGIDKNDYRNLGIGLKSIKILA